MVMYAFSFNARTIEVISFNQRSTISLPLFASQDWCQFCFLSLWTQSTPHSSRSCRCWRPCWSGCRSTCWPRRRWLGSRACPWWRGCRQALKNMFLWSGKKSQMDGKDGRWFLMTSDWVTESHVVKTCVLKSHKHWSIKMKLYRFLYVQCLRYFENWYLICILRYAVNFAPWPLTKKKCEST